MDEALAHANFSTCRLSLNSHPIPTLLSNDERSEVQLLFDAARGTSGGRQTSVEHPETVLPHQQGLFGHPLLRTHAGFLTASERTLQRAQRLVELIETAESAQDLRRVVKMMDQLSDELCSIMDIAEFVRMAHPDVTYRQAAHQAYSKLFDYMNQLNTHPQLYFQLKRAMETPRIAQDFTPVEHQVAVQFLRDFEKSGVHLPDRQRARFISLSNDILSLSHEFLHPNPVTRTFPDSIAVDSSDRLQGLPLSVVQSLQHTNQSHPLRIPVPSSLSNMITSMAHDEELRKQVYTLQKQTSTQQVEVLEDLLRLRKQLAELTGRSTYSHLFLEDKMAQHPDHVRTFLKNLAQHIQPQVEREVQHLVAVKHQQAHGLSSSPGLQAWDQDYCLKLARAQLRAQCQSDSLHGYFTVGGAMQGLNMLFKRLYGITFEPGTVAPGEVWHGDVQKLSVIDESGTHIGTIYCDLFSRPDKTFSGAAHFTIRCARRLDDDIVLSSSSTDSTGSGQMSTAFHSPLRAVDQVRTDPATGQQFQRPVVVLVCNFEQRQSPEEPTLLSLFDLETLFHEMGHAMHSMLALTSFHNVAGTRCAVDFVELPSVLMEHFAHDYRVLKLFARHYQTGAPLEQAQLQAHLAQRKAFIGIETTSQILMAVMDQCYHGHIIDSRGANFQDVLQYIGKPSLTPFDTDPRLVNSPLTKLSASALSPGSQFTSHTLRMLQNAGLPWSPVPYVAGVNWQVSIGHLVGYGGGYYAYLFDRVLASRVWETKFAADPLSREAGEAYRDKLLRWGGGRNPWQCIGDILEDDTLRRGDET
ncbi:Mitochondrial intermediate peptidase, partial [Dispira parvispora]